jgi:PTH1 family peptidyl-tRNA hydrolase
MKLIVGLGNPGREYAGTRHNIGFEVLDSLAVRAGWVFGADGFDRMSRTNFDGLTLDGPVTLPGGATEKALLLKPMTYMNLSGKAVQAAMAFHKLSPDDVMIVLDDMALPAGRIRIRPGGSHGGHNGLRDIERALGTSQYPRLRIGIDSPPGRVPWRDYVLQKFTTEQRRATDPAVGRAVDALLTWMESGVTTAMNRFNAEDEKNTRKDE